MSSDSRKRPEAVTGYGSDFELAREFLRSGGKQRYEKQQKTENDRKREKRLTLLIGVIGGVLVITIIAAVVAFQAEKKAARALEQAEEQRVFAEEQRARAEAQRIHAEEQRRIAQHEEQRARKLLARYFANVSKNTQKSSPVLSLLLAVEAISASPIAAAREALREAVSNTDGSPLASHEGYVISVAYSGNGKQLASGSFDNTVRLWNLADPEAEPRVLRGHEGSVWSVAYSGNGKQLASGSSDNTVRLWNLADPEVGPRVLRGHEGEVLSVAYSADGKQLASGSSDTTVRLWDLKVSKAEPRVLRGHEGEVLSVAYSGDGKQLASGSSDTTVRLWNLADPEVEPRVLHGYEGDVWSVAYSSHGKQLAAGGLDTKVWLWNLEAPEAEPIILRGHEGDVWSVAYSGNGKQLASGSVDNTVRLWTMQTKALIELACSRAGRNMTLVEWHTFLGEETHRKVCDDLPYDGSFIERGRDFARKGNITQALVFFQETLIEDGVPDSDAAGEARKLVAPALLERGAEIAEQGKIEEAIGAYAQAREFDEALQISAIQFNQLCWWGSLWGYAAKVMEACGNAVRLDPEAGENRDSRGVARALTGDFTGAMADFQYYVDWAPRNEAQEYVPERQSWIEALEAGRNPFDAQTLEALKIE